MNLLLKLCSRFIAFLCVSFAFSSSLYAQDGGAVNQENVIKVSHIVDFVTLQRGDNDNKQVLENEILNIGDIVRTGDDSAVRITFPDGTVQVLCENTSFQVTESGTEESDGSEAEVIAAFSRCDIKPRFIGRCFDRGDNFLSNFAKAGQEPKVGDEALSNSSDSGLSRDFSGRCTAGERLFLTFNNIEPPVVEEAVESVPEPTPEPVTVPETGGSPVI